MTQIRNSLPKDHPYFDSKTEKQWKALKRVVKKEASGEVMYFNGFRQQLGKYFTENETRPATEEELESWRAEKREIARKKRAEIKAKEERERIAEEKRNERERERSRKLREVAKEKIICLDVETTGLYPGSDEILQISIINGKGEVLLNEYVRPRFNTEWEAAYEIHGISPEMVANEETIDELLPVLNHIIGSAELIVGYNLDFDLSFLRFSGIEVPESAIQYDVMCEFASIYGEWSSYYKSYKWKSLETCADYFKYERTGYFHDSLEDVRATMHCFYKMING